jgi:hypothetical protein
MTTLLITVFQKNGAVFADATEAFANKNSQFPADLTQEIAQSNQTMLDQGVLLQDPELTWDQDTFRLTVKRMVTSHLDFLNLRTFSLHDAELYSLQAGWTMVSNSVEQL